MARIKIDLPQNFSFSTEVVVEVSDINYGGHLGNDRVLSFVHEARLRFLKQFGYTELDVDGAGTIMVDAAILYKGEAFHGDRMKIEVAVGDFHKVGCDFFFKIINSANNKEIAHIKTGMVFFDYEKRRMLPVPQKFKRLCQQSN